MKMSPICCDIKNPTNFLVVYIWKLGKLELKSSIPFYLLPLKVNKLHKVIYIILRTLCNLLILSTVINFKFITNGSETRA